MRDSSATSGLFADASNFELRFVPDYARITEIVAALRVLRVKVVLTMGTFDILHEGHSMYLEAARGFGDFLIVGVDSDEKVRRRKGVWRPAVPELERLRMVTHQRGVGLVTLKPADEPRWSLINAVRPDVLVATEDTYRPRRSPSWSRSTAAGSRCSTGWPRCRRRPGCGCCSWDSASGCRSGCPSACRTCCRTSSTRSAAAAEAAPALPARCCTPGMRRSSTGTRDAAEILLLGSSFAEEFPALRKEIRALDADRRGRLPDRGPTAVPVRVIERTDLPEARSAGRRAGGAGRGDHARAGRPTSARRRPRGGVGADLPALGPGVEPGPAATPATTVRSPSTRWPASSRCGPPTRRGSVRTGGVRSARSRYATGRARRRPQRTPTDRVLAVPQRRSPQRLQPRCPHRTVHRHPRRGRDRGPRRPGPAPRSTAPTSTCRRSPAPAVPGWWPRPDSAGATSPDRTPCWTATRCYARPGVELIWVDLAGT